MEIKVSADAPLDGADSCVLFATRESGPPSADLPPEVAARLAAVRELGDFKGKRGETCLLYGEGDAPPRRWLLVGLGETERVDERAWRSAAAAAQVALAGRDCADALFLLPSGADGAEIAAGLMLSGYCYDRFFLDEEKRGKHLSAATLRPAAGESADALGAAVERGRIAAGGTLKARELLNGPANVVTPAALADAARGIAERSQGRIACRVLDEAELAAENCQAILAVGRASENESHLLVLEYAPQGMKPAKTVAFVGKGVTFDTGGISLKPPALMDEMKYDMGGAAAVLGLFHALAELDLPLKVVGLVPTVENMPGGAAYRPGDIVVTRSGLSIEVKNTDAEGRVIMSDALDFAKQYEPDLLVDLATLTGACVVALAHEAAGCMANARGEDFVPALRASGDRTGERVWPLPMYEEYEELIKSDVADVCNTGGRYGGAITAGKFLQRFADHAPWIHLDIAGPAHTGKERDITPKGGNGFGVRLLLDFLSGLEG